MNIQGTTTPPVAIFTGQSQSGFKSAATNTGHQTPVQEVQIPETAEQARYEEVKRAAESVKTTYFAVSDVRFTIFKDIAGDYVTRFTSLKDGSVKYFPQKSLFEMMQIRHSNLSSIQTEA